MFQTTLKIDGMMCGMCEAHVNEVIRKEIPDAQKVKSSHTSGKSSFISEKRPDTEELSVAIAETGYTVQAVDVQPYTKKKFLGLF